MAIKDTQINASVTMDREVHKKLKEDAERNHRSFSKHVEYILKQYLTELERSENK